MLSAAQKAARAHALDMPFGRKHMFYAEASETRCAFALMLDVNPVALICGSGGAQTSLFDQYVNDRPYAASSFLSVALAKVLRTALGGRSQENQQLVDGVIPLEATVTPLRARGKSNLVRQLFEPRGYAVGIEEIPTGCGFIRHLG